MNQWNLRTKNQPEPTQRALQRPAVGYTRLLRSIDLCPDLAQQLRGRQRRCGKDLRSRALNRLPGRELKLAGCAGYQMSAYPPGAAGVQLPIHIGWQKIHDMRVVSRDPCCHLFVSSFASSRVRNARRALLKRLLTVPTGTSSMVAVS